MLTFILLLVVAAIAFVLVMAARRPDDFRIERSVRIGAPPERIFPLINDLQRFRTWSPFEHDGLIRTFSGPQSGPGAVYDFDGPASKGVGRCSIVGATPPARVAMKLDMTKPLEAHNTIEFTLEPRAEQTEVTWVMWGRNGYVPKLMGLFVDMDGMCGREFDKGLATLKAVVEDGSHAGAAAAAGIPGTPAASRG